VDSSAFFVVRIWCDASGFHASARDVRHEEVVEFADPAALAAFLVAGVARPRPILLRQQTRGTNEQQR
jgi:hypothetical protein